MTRTATALAPLARRLALTVALGVGLHATSQANAKAIFSESFETPAVAGKADVTPVGLDAIWKLS